MRFGVCVSLVIGILIELVMTNSVTINTIPATIGASGGLFKVTGSFTSFPSNENDTRVIGVEMLSVGDRSVAARVPKSIGVERQGDFEAQLYANSVDQDKTYFIYVFLALERELFNISIQNPTKLAEYDSKARIRVIPTVIYPPPDENPVAGSSKDDKETKESPESISDTTESNAESSMSPGIVAIIVITSFIGTILVTIICWKTLLYYKSVAQEQHADPVIPHVIRRQGQDEREIDVMGDYLDALRARPS